jgi:hypothetical protein
LNVSFEIVITHYASFIKVIKLNQEILQSPTMGIVSLPAVLMGE